MNPALDPSSFDRNLCLKVIGVGGAGGNAVDYMARQDFTGVTFVVANTDSQALAKMNVEHRLTLGSALTRGLGTGGDPDLGRAAAEADIEQIKAICTGAHVVCVVAGLGGGTGTGAGPVVARVARECGALVLGIVTLPFEFEGTRRQRQAQMGLRNLKIAADGVISLPNQKVLKLVDEKTTVPDALKYTNELLCQGVRGIWQLLSQTGMINVDFNDLCAVLRDRHEESSLATVEACGENRALEVIEKLAVHPFLEGGQVLSEADAVLVSLTSGPDLTMAEVNRLMEQINRQCENAHIIMGAGIQEAMSGKLSVTVVASKRQGSLERSQSRGTGLSAPAPQVDPIQESILAPAVVPQATSRFVPPAPELTLEQTGRLLTEQGDSPARSRKKANLMRQGQLQLEIVSKGRFEKSEPTIHQGEDLDVPTYIRRGVALN